MRARKNKIITTKRSDATTSSWSRQEDHHRRRLVALVPPLSAVRRACMLSVPSSKPSSEVLPRKQTLPLNIVFDNCSGQNKNNTVLKLAAWLMAMGYFKSVQFIFLVVGHTKNPADRLFNSLKHDYRKQSLFTIDELASVSIFLRGYLLVVT